jgi:hypothetical protein
VSAFDPDTLTTWLDGTEVAVSEIPNAEMRAVLGMGHHPRHVAGRKIHLGTFRYNVDTCREDERRTEWRGTTLVCTGCGLDVS